jgi:hypothetical protein
VRRADRRIIAIRLDISVQPIGESSHAVWLLTARPTPPAPRPWQFVAAGLPHRSLLCGGGGAMGVAQRGPATWDRILHLPPPPPRPRENHITGGAETRLGSRLLPYLLHGNTLRTPGLAKDTPGLGISSRRGTLKSAAKGNPQVHGVRGLRTRRELAGDQRKVIPLIPAPCVGHCCPPVIALGGALHYADRFVILRQSPTTATCHA